MEPAKPHARTGSLKRLLSYNAVLQFQDVALGTATTMTVRDEFLFSRFLALSGGKTWALYH